MKILYEDSNIIVCVKPAGIATESASVSSRDMVSLLKTYLVRQGRCKGREPYLAVIHRLDQPVEGIMVFALTKKAAAALSKELSAGEFIKYYLAVIEGEPAIEGRLTDYIVQEGNGRNISFADKETANARKCELEYKVAGTSVIDGKKCSLVVIHLLTGRFHQIRLQLAHIGTPIAGDRRHGNEPGAYNGNLLLCSCMLSFRHPETKKRMTYRIVPSDPVFSKFDTEAAINGCKC